MSPRPLEDSSMRRIAPHVLLSVVLVGFLAMPTLAQRTQKPVLHGKHWVAVTGKPLAATAGALVFAKGGNAVDAACAMLGATSTMWDTLGWGGETQALIYNPQDRQGRRHQRPRRRPHRRHGGVSSERPGHALPARVRTRWRR